MWRTEHHSHEPAACRLREPERGLEPRDPEPDVVRPVRRQISVARSLLPAW